MKKASRLLSVTLAAMVLISALAAIPASATGTEVTVDSLPELQEAIAAAADGDVIYIAGDIEIQEEVSIGTVDKTVSLAGAEGTSVVLSISPDFPDGQSVSFANLVFCGGQSSGLSFVQSGGISHLQAVRFQHPNENSGKSACLIERGSATFSNCHFEEGRAERGGHIYAGTDAAVHANNCAFMTGAASECGGSIYALGSVNITDCSFSNGCAENAGGSVYAAGPLRLVDCTFYGGNSGIGGQLFCSGTAAEIIGCSFTQGYASQYGGGIGSDGDISIADCTITSCSAGQHGGGVWSAGAAEIQRCKIYGNSAEIAGADLYAANGLTVLDTAEDYLTLYERELAAAEMNAAGWYLDDASQRYVGNSPTTALATPSEADGQPVALAFAFSRVSLPEPPEEDSGDDSQPDPPAPATPPSSSSGHHSSGTTSPAQNNKPTRAPLRCGTAEINTSAAVELCQVLPKYIPESKIISRAEAAGYLYGILNREETADTSPKTLTFYSDTEDNAYRKEIDSLTEDGIFSGCGNSRFAPDSPLTRAQMIMIFARFAEPQEYDIKHMDIAGHWAEAGIKTAVALGWMEDSPIDLHAAITLSDFASFLSKVVAEQ